MNLWGVLAVAAVLYAIRMAGAQDLADSYHQERAAAYVMDALRNGNWICQYGYYGEVTSKPPMLTWLAALASLPFKQANWFSLTLPGALATTTLAVLIFVVGRRFFGQMAGFCGALLYLISPIGAKQMVLARIDGLFSLTVAMTALLAFRAWQTGRGWTWFWIAGAIATLTKGPLGLVLGAFGLLAIYWERRTGFSSPAKGNHLPGVILYFVISGGWLALAYAAMGQPLIDIMLGRELVGHVVSSSRGPGPLAHFYFPLVAFFSRYAPWCILTCIGLVRAFKRPSPDADARRLERFLSCWFLTGIFVFCFAAHQRADLIFPLIPPAALLAGRVAADWLAPRTRLTRWVVPVGAAAALLAISFNYLYAIQNRARVKRTAALQRMARLVKSAGGTMFPLTHVQSPYGLQFYLNTKKMPASAAWGVRLLGAQPKVFIATSEPDKIRKALPNQTNLYVLDSWRGSRSETVQIISNHPRLEWTDEMNWLAKPCLFQLTDVDDVDSCGDTFTFETKAATASVTVRSAVTGPIRVRDLTSGGEEVLGTNEAWPLTFTGKLRLQIFWRSANDDAKVSPVW